MQVTETPVTSGTLADCVITCMRRGHTLMVRHQGGNHGNGNHGNGHYGNCSCVQEDPTGSALGNVDDIYTLG